jgi:hypothetical protein
VSAAEEIHEAAALMRERAVRAIPSPWHVDRHEDGRAWICETIDGDEIGTLAMHGYPSTAEHIASWHPNVALAVADWLDCQADTTCDCGVDESALTLARTYLGRAS